MGRTKAHAGHPRAATPSPYRHRPPGRRLGPDGRLVGGPRPVSSPTSEPDGHVVPADGDVDVAKVETTADCLQHLRGNLDSCDPVLPDRLASDREILLLDERRVGGVERRHPRRSRTWPRTSCASPAPSDCGAPTCSVRRVLLAGTAPRGALRSHRSTARPPEAIVPPFPVTSPIGTAVDVLICVAFRWAPLHGLHLHV